MRFGQVVAWRRGRTGAWPRQGLLQWHQVSPGAASAQAHLQGHLWVAARGECRSGQLATTSQAPTLGQSQCKADTPQHTHSNTATGHTIMHTPGDRQAGRLTHTHTQHSTSTLAESAT